MKITGKARAVVSAASEYAKRAEYRDEIARCEREVELYTKLSIMYEMRGMALVKQGLFDEATGAWVEAVEYESKLAEVYCHRGTAYYLLGEYKRALHDFNKALRIKENDLPALHNRGWVYLQLGMPDEAEKDFQKVRKLNPEFAAAWEASGIFDFLSAHA